jgi:hypothetical protein
MKKWLLLFAIIALALLFFTKERFEATSTIKNPSSWDAAEIARIRAMGTTTATDDEIRTVVGGFWSAWQSATLQITLSDITSYMSTQNLSQTKKIELTNLVKAYYIDQGQSVFEAARGYGGGGNTATTSSATAEDVEAQMNAAMAAADTAASDTAASDTAASDTAAGDTAAGDTATVEDIEADMVAATGGSTTTGSSPAAGTGKDVWGPVFPGLGPGDGSAGTGSTEAVRYPTLFGGFMGKSSEMTENAGPVPPPADVLPSSASLGSAPNSGYLPYSRQPGDMDLIPDPYRLARTFSSSNYSSTRSEPVPFLTDFSAFMS